jgi:hypothetical protein
MTDDKIEILMIIQKREREITNALITMFICTIVGIGSILLWWIVNEAIADSMWWLYV